MRDLYNNVKVKLMAAPTDLVHTDTWLGYIDTQGFEGAVVGVIIGDLTGVDGSNYLTPTLYEASVTPGTASNYSLVAAADILGGFTKVDATTEDVCIQTVGYVGGKRYVGVKAVYTGTTISAGVIGAFAVVDYAAHKPDSGVTLTSGTIT